MPTDYKRVLQRAKAARRGSRARRCGDETGTFAIQAGPLRPGRFAAWVSQPVSRSIRRKTRAVSRPRAHGSRTSAKSSRSPPRSICARKGRAAWTAACRSASPTRGCPIDNLIPEWNDLVYHGRWRDALDRLHKTNNFPEFTGRTCPAPCEGACVLGITDPAGDDQEHRERDHRPRLRRRLDRAAPAAEARTGKKVAIIGSGPAGLAAADQLNKVGHTVTVYERADRIGGLLMYGIPNMKLDKAGRAAARRSAGATKASASSPTPTSATNVDAGAAARVENDALLLATGATQPRDLPIPGRELDGHPLRDGVPHREHQEPARQRARRTASSSAPRARTSIVIGGGDTGTDCIGTSMRHGCKSLVNFELLPQPPAKRAPDNPWPQWPRIFRTDYGHEEDRAQVRRRPAHLLRHEQGVLGDDHGNVAGIRTVGVDWQRRTAAVEAQRASTAPSEILAGRSRPAGDGLPRPRSSTSRRMLGVELDPRTNYKAEHGKFATSVPGVFAAATAAAANRSSSGPSTKAAAPPAPSMNS